MNDQLTKRVINATGLVTLTLLSAVTYADEPVDYIRDIRPILSNNCYACHGPDAESREAELRLDMLESTIDELPSGEHAVVPGKPDESELLRRMISDDEDELMPPTETGKSLKPEQVELIRRWIEQGAQWQEHWSFVTPERPEPPTVSDANWPHNEIDSFILSRLDSEGLKPTSAADKETLLRRVTFDLTGLPPTLAEIDAFLADDSLMAYEQTVDRLLRSPHYGEHMARFWLDAARYSDTHGLHFDNYREIWPYRDWVVRAFNNNMPYDQFTIEQLAGDLLSDATLEQRVATGFGRCNVSTNEAGSIEEEVYTRNVIDRVTTMGTVFLGLTFECTRCHDHKFDPLTQHDFYSLFAFFNSLDGPALDGNVADTQPSEHVPTLEQAAMLAQTNKQIEELQARQEKYRKVMESVFQLWLEEQRLQLGSGVSPENVSPSEGLVGHYSLDVQPDDKVANSVAPESPGRTHGDPQSVPSRYGQAIEISTEAYIDLGDVFDLEHDRSFSFGVWVRVPEGTSGTIFSKTTDDERGYALQTEQGHVALFLTNVANLYGIHVVSEDHLLTPDDWHHVFVSYDASAKAAGIVLYVDGKRRPLVTKRDSIVTYGAPSSLDSDDAHFLVGRHAAGRPLSGGQIDELRFYDRRLAFSEVIGVMFADGVQELLSQEPDQLTPKQIEELRQVYFHFFDATYAEMADQIDQTYLRQIEVKNSIPVSLVWRERKEPRDAFLLIRGEYDQKGEKVARATPAVFSPLPEDAPQNRLGLAQWLVDSQNPLTARVAVNRFWAQVFGTGLVKTAEDFGSQGDVPSHPALFDWLTIDFVENDWNIKALMKTIVLSSTYRQSSRMTPEIVERDPENRLLAHGPRFRLDAEMLRDQALEVSGMLVKTLGGPSVRPPQPDGLWHAVGFSRSNTARFVTDIDHEQVHRRTLYTFFKRTSPPPQMSTFDAPSREGCIVRRERTNTPLQALLMLNDPQYVEAARALAQRTMREGEADPESRIRMMMRLCTGREAKQAAIDELHKLYREQLEQFEKNPERAKLLVNVGQPLRGDPLEVTRLAAWTVVANVVLNLDEVVTKN